MADPLTLQLDQLLKDMQNVKPKKRRRRRKKHSSGKDYYSHQLESGWNNKTSSHMARLPSYDAMRDPHCRYTRKKQFRRHHNKYKEVQMMSEILRGDHAGLNDIVTPSKLSPLPKPDLPGISQKNQHSGKKKSPLLKMQHLQRTTSSICHDSYT